MPNPNIDNFGTNEINLDHDIAGEFEAAIDPSKLNSVKYEDPGTLNDFSAARMTGSIMGGDSRVFSTPRYLS